MTAPIFIVGANRSGTTLLRLMLNAHSRIAVPEEIVYFKSVSAGLPIEDWQSTDLSPSDYEAFVDEVLDANPTLLRELDRATVKTALLKPAPYDLRRPYAGLLAAWARAQGKPRWGEKTPGNLFFVDVLLEMFPDARFIHLVRDPRAGVASMQRVDFFPNSVFFNAMSRAKHHRVARRMASLVPADQWTTVRYEDLVSDAPRELETLCRFIGEPFETQMLRFHRSSSTYMKAEAASSFNAAATRPVTTAMTEKWKDQLSARDTAIIETICQDEMTAHGYEPTSHVLGARDRGRLLIHAGYWALQTWRNRHIREFTVKSPMFARSRDRLRRWIAPRLPALASWLGV